MHGSSMLRTYAITICMVFVISVTWCIHAVYVSSVNSAASILKQTTRVQTRKQLTESMLQVEMHNSGNSSTLSSSTKSALFQLTVALRPGQSQPIPAAKDVQDIPVFDVLFYNERGNLISGWLAISSPHAPVIILTHGTPGNRVDMVKRAAFLFRHGYTVLLFDFQSYGKSQGVTSTLGMVESDDILAAIAFLRSYPDTIDSRIGVLGLSMGATAAVLAAARSTDISALVAESCPVDATHVPGDVPNELVRDADRQLVEEIYGVDISRARPIDVVNRLSGHTALFFINGDNDDQTPVDGMYALYNAAGSPRQSWVVHGAGHAQSFALDPLDYEVRVDHFFDTYLG